MSSRSVEDELWEQFYRWELRGRGWAAWPAPVHLEPPFRPFLGHYITQRAVEDDGRRDSVFTGIRKLFTGPTRQLARVEPEPPEPSLSYLADDEPIAAFVLHVPRDFRPTVDAGRSILAALRGARHPIAFELVGSGGEVAIQIACRGLDERLALAALRTYAPEAVPVGGDLVAATFGDLSYDALAVLELGLCREFMLPLAIARSFEPDPLNAFVAALDDCAEIEAATVQVLFEPARDPWAESMLRAVNDNEGGDFFEDNPEIRRAASAKAMQPLFAVAVRVAVAGETMSQARERVARLASALAELEDPAGNQLSFLDQNVPYDRLADLLERRSHRSGMLWGLDELSSLVHLPSPSVRTKALLGRESNGTRALENAPNSGIYLGLNRHAGREVPVYLTREQARRHVHVIGASGSGKSNLLLQALRGHAADDGGFALLDPHGDLADDLLSRLPEDRASDVIVFDPADMERPVGFNVLAAKTDLEKTLLASDLVAIFRRLSTSWGDQMHTVLANAIQAFLESRRGGTLADLRKFLVDPQVRADFLATVDDEEVTYYWRNEFPLLRGNPQGPILTRLDAFLRPKLIRQMVAQRENQIDFRDVMDTGKIFLAKLAQGAIGEENAALLGSFLMARLHQAAMSRQDVAADKRRLFLLAADECQHFVTPSMAAMLVGSRKFAVGLVLLHQNLAQIERRDSEVFSSLMANAGTRIAFRVGDADARGLAEGFAHFSPEDLRSLPIGHAICRFDRADRDFSLVVPLASALSESEAQARRGLFTDMSRLRYGSSPMNALAPAQTEDVHRDPPDEPTQELPVPPAPARDARPIHHSEPEPPPTEIARRAVAPARPANADHLGRGGAQHTYLQELVKRFAEAQGYRATIEKPTPGGGSIDVALERADGSIAVEISVTSTAAYETSNIEKCLAAGYGRVVLLSSDRRRLETVATAVRKAVDARDLTRVEFLLAEDFLAWLAAQTPPSPVEERVGGYKVKVRYKKGTDEETAARQRAIAEVVAKSTRKLPK